MIAITSEIAKTRVPHFWPILPEVSLSKVTPISVATSDFDDD